MCDTICFCNSNRAWGGGEKWHLETARYFAAAGYRVILAANAASPLWVAASQAMEQAAGQAESLAASQANGQTNLELFDWRPGNLSFLNPCKVAAFAAFLRRERVSRLILNLPADLKLAVPAVRLSGLAGQTGQAGSGLRVYYRRGSAIPVRPSLLNKKLYAGLTGVIANSAETARCVAASGVLPPERVHVIYNGLDVRAFDAALREEAELIQWPERFEARQPLIIGNAGRLSRQKGQKYLLHMSAVLQARGFPHRLVICGEGELRRELEDLAAALGLAWTKNWPVWQAGLTGSTGGGDMRSLSRKGSGTGGAQSAGLCLAGFQANLAPFWRSIHLFALSSIWEGFGYVLAEAMLAHRPLLAFNCNSMPELVRDGQNGTLIAPPEADESDAAVGARLAVQVEAMAENPQKLKQFGLAGRAFCLENFDQTVSMARLKKLLFS